MRAAWTRSSFISMYISVFSQPEKNGRTANCSIPMDRRSLKSFVDRSQSSGPLHSQVTLTCRAQMAMCADCRFRQRFRNHFALLGWNLTLSIMLHSFVKSCCFYAVVFLLSDSFIVQWWPRCRELRSTDGGFHTAYSSESPNSHFKQLTDYCFMNEWMNV